MASQYLNLEGAQYLVNKIKSEINAGDLKSIKKVYFDAATNTIKFFKDENALDTELADFQVIIPDDVDTSNLIEKLQTPTDGNVVIADADGGIKDGGILLTALATKEEVNNISDTKIGDLNDLNTNEKNSIIDAINEIEGQVDALQRGSYDDSELRNLIGELTSLTTTEKNSLVEAINEIDAELGTAKTEAVVSIEDGGNDNTSAKIYIVKQNGQEVGKINIPKDMVVQSGQVVNNPDGQTPGKYVELTIANGTGDKIYINVADLVDAYTAKLNAEKVQLAISDTNEISATIVAESITATELANNSITTDKVLDDSITLAKLADDVNTAFDSKGSAAAAQQNAQNYADQKFAEITSISNDEIDGLF